ncbi:MAG TPA: hypothetical protein VGQ71_01465, partial [Terriglobales bacterium]|nr:hypothetical protein [Terriglobales bacterium]
MQSLLIFLLLTVAAAAQAQMPDFSGTWRLDRDLTTADLRWNKITILTVSQSDGEVRFHYFDRDRSL